MPIPQTLRRVRGIVPLVSRRSRGGNIVTSTPVAPSSLADHVVYAVAGGNHVTIELDRAMTGGPST